MVWIKRVIQTTAKIRFLVTDGYIIKIKTIKLLAFSILINSKYFVCKKDGVKPVEFLPAYVDINCVFSPKAFHIAMRFSLEQKMYHVNQLCF